MVHVGIHVTKPFPADEFFPVKVSGIIPELDMTFVWDFSPFLVKRHIVFLLIKHRFFR
jgi:hypothetical protein